MTDETAFPGRNVQDEPKLAQNTTTTPEQIQGIVVQTEADLREEPVERIREVLEQRMTQSGLSTDGVDLDGLAAGIVARRG